MDTFIYHILQNLVSRYNQILMLDTNIFKNAMNNNFFDSGLKNLYFNYPIIFAADLITSQFYNQYTSIMFLW